VPTQTRSALRQGVFCAVVLLLALGMSGSAAATQSQYDCGDPTADEQLVLEYVNRARANPTAEGTRLGIDITEGLVAPNGPNLVQVRPPLAMNKILLGTARAHSQDMWTNNYFAHNDPSGNTPPQRMTAAGYNWTKAGENIATSSSASAASLEDLLMVDANVAGRGHRVNLLDIFSEPPDPPYQEIGIGYYSGANPDASGFKDFLTQDFGTGTSAPAGTTGPFLLGVVYKDTNGNNFYDIGEGVSGVTITPDSGAFFAVSSTSGGYAFPVASSGTLTVTASGGPLTSNIVKTVTLTGSNIKLDFLVNSSGSGGGAPAITSATSASGTAGQAFTYQIAASNSPTSYNATPLPAGLSVSTSTGAITGTPTTAGSTNVTISATNASGTGSATLTITISSSGGAGAPAITSATSASGTTGQAFTYQIAASNSPTSYNATPLPAGLSVSTSTGAITGTPTTAGSTNVTLSATNASGTGSATLAITINSSASGAPVITSATTSNGNVGLAFRYQIVASNSPTSYNATPLPAGLSVSSSTGAITGTPTTAGTTNVTISATNASGTGSTNLAITITSGGGGGGAAPAITSATTATGAVGTAFSYTITATNSPTKYAASGLPAGLSLDKNGNISGTPKYGGQYGVVLSVTNAGGTTQIVLTLTVSGGAGAPVITSPITAAGSVGTPFLYGCGAKGALPITFSATNLPPGLSLTSNGNAISGTPTTVGTTSVTLTATNSSGVSQAMTLTIGIGPAGSPLPKVIPAGNPKGSKGSLSDSYKDVIATTGTGDSKSTDQYGTSSLSIKLTIPLDAIADFSAIDETTNFNLSAGGYAISFALGDARASGPNGKGGKLSTKNGSGTATFLEAVTETVNPDTGASKDVKYGSVSLKWDKKKKLLTVTATRSVPIALTKYGDADTSNIICGEGDTGAVAGDVDVEVDFGAAYAFLTAHMTGTARTADKTVGHGSNAQPFTLTTSNAKGTATPTPASQ